ncbi:ATP-binding protein, partial [Parabacteroides distasonis]
METVNRILQEKITARIAPNKAVLIFGARRVGKTVMMRKIVDNYSGRTMMLNGEDYDTLALLENRSIANYRHLLDGIDLLAIDEAQNIPQIGSILKLIVDEIPGISVLASGSSSFDLLNKTGEPLVGRSTQFLLTPFSQREIAQTETALETRQNLEARLIYGSYPEVVMMENYERKTDYLRDIVGAYLLKDILAIDGLKNSSKMRDLLRLIAFQLGSEVSYEELGKQLGMSKT